MPCPVCGPEDCDRYSHNLRLRAMAGSLVGHRIMEAHLEEANGIAILKISLEDGRTVDVGVSGNLYDGVCRCTITAGKAGVMLIPW